VQRFQAAPPTLSRRTFLGIAAALLLLRPRWAAGLAAIEAPRRLAFVHTHTKEKLVVDYWREGVYDPEELRRVNHFLRDFRTGAEYEIDPGLLDVLCDLARVTRTSSPFHVISGYRSPRTNEMLREAGHGVAKNSQHVVGRAIDVRLDDVSTAALRDAAVGLGRGGVGFYPGDGFVHVDTGRVRRW
jgi:uncharacterized protein YcbK (DUF882 family)